MKQLHETNAAWISDEDVERALTFLRDKAKEIAAAKAEKLKEEFMLKHIIIYLNKSTHPPTNKKPLLK